MWITRRTDYAARAVLALCVAPPDELLTVEDIAHRTATPVSVTKQVMNQLRVSGLVHSERGPSGGYRLEGAPGAWTDGSARRIDAPTTANRQSDRR